MIVLATANPHKVAELGGLLVPAGLEVVGLEEAVARGHRPADGSALAEPAETGRTFEENAAIKALGYAAQTGLVCLADDSGLQIDALAGAPGVISSHYSTGGQETGLTRAERDAANNQRVLAELAGVAPAQRTARFVCVMCLASPGRVLATTRGTFEGRIGEPPAVPRGDHGFGYDPLFLVADQFARTSAELDAEEKNRRSHRGAAARRMVEWLRAHPLR